mmetsp:Transcript_8671/g.24483  ORF Transcript_8671/g.24483 Transcript_8671/m.24483 type:complete len:200 (-) Transcript_8671:717-1316(-)
MDACDDQTTTSRSPLAFTVPSIHVTVQTHGRDLLTCIAEPYPSHGGGEQHRLLGIQVVLVLDTPFEMFTQGLEGLHAPYIGHGIGSLVCRSQDRALGARTPFVVGDGRVALQGVAQDVESGRRRDAHRHGSTVVDVDDAEHGSDPSRTDSRLRLEGLVIEDRDTGRLTSRPGGGGDADQGHDGARHGEALAHWGVDKVK